MGFLAVVINNYKATLYCNGVEVESSTQSSFNFPSNFYIGGRPGGYFANVLVNDFRIYDHCLSQKK